MRFAAIVALLLSVLGAGAAAPRPAPPLNLAKEPALQERITFRGDVLHLHEAVRALGDTAGVPVAVQGEVLRRRVALAVREKSCAEVMEILASLFGGTWVKKGGAYVLITDEALANLVGAYPETGNTQGLEQALARSLTVPQLGSLSKNGVLTVDAFNRPQRELVQAIMRDRYLREPDRYPSSVLTGRGVRLTTPPDSAPVPSISVTVEGEQGRIPARLTISRAVCLQAPMIEENGELALTTIAELINR